MFRTLSSSFGYDVTNNINLIASIMQLNFTIDANYSLEYGNIHTNDSTLVTSFGINFTVNPDPRIPSYTVDEYINLLTSDDTMSELQRFKNLSYKPEPLSETLNIYGTFHVIFKNH